MIVVNVTGAPGVLGGAVLAAQWHSWYMAKKRRVNLWRMWNDTQDADIGHLPVRNFLARPWFGWLGLRMPVLLQKVLLKSDIVAALEQEQPQIVHLQNPAPSLEFARIAASCKRRGIKVVASTHGFQEIFDPQYGFDKLHQRIGWQLLITWPLKRAFRNVDAFLVGYPQQIEFMVGLGVSRDKLFLVPNGIDPYFDAPATSAECDAARIKFGLASEIPILLFMGNHTPNKKIDLLMTLASRLRKPATVVIGGKLREGEPQKWTSGISLPPGVRVIFTDFLSVAEQRALYAIARVFAFPSISETLPLVILEAQAAGLPTVAFATGGIGFELEEEAGFAVPLNDFEAFEAAVVRLMEDDALHGRMSKAARERQRKFFSWDFLADKTLSVYDQLTASSHLPSTLPRIQSE